jgi:hypothetical protein
LIADPGLRTSVYSDVRSDIRVRPYTRATPEVCPSLSGAGGGTAQATKSRSGAADDPTGWIADPGLRTSVYPDVCSGIRVWRGNRTTSEICPKLGGASGVAAQAAVSHRCAGGGTGLIASARSSSRHLRQTQWYCHKANRNQSKFNRCNLSHIIFPPSHVVLGLSDVSFIFQNILLEQIRRYCARGGFFSATVEVIGAPPFEIVWSGPRGQSTDETFV